MLTKQTVLVGKILGFLFDLLFGLFIKIIDALCELIAIEPFKRKEDAQPLTAEQKFALNIGAILSEQRRAFCNTLGTGEKPRTLISGLAKHWGINSPSSAKKTLDWLLSEGHRTFYPNVLDSMKYDDKQTLAEYICSFVDDEEVGTQLFRFTENLKSTKKDLAEFEVVRSNNDFMVDITAWDTGRCVGVARMCYEANYLTEEEAWEFIHQAAALSKSVYSSWKEFARSYTIGRAMWSGPCIMLDNIMFFQKNLQEHENSPWLDSPWVQ